MAVYEYKGLDAEGKETAGMIDADSPRLARTRLRERQIFTTELSPVVEKATQNRDSSSSGRVSLKETSITTRQLATLIGSGIPLMESLAALVEQTEKPAARKVWLTVQEKVREGSSLADALARYPKVFPTLYQQMIRAGEASGTLDLILVRLAEYMESQVALRSKIFSILAYPVLVLGMSGMILFFLIAFVVPKVTVIFTDLNKALPWPTVLLLTMSDLFRHYGLLLLLLLGMGGVALQRVIQTPQGRWHYDRLSLKLPFIGRLFSIMAVARFAKTLATLLSGGVPLLTALSIVEKVVGNKVIEAAVAKARENIQEGEGIAAPLKRSGLFPLLLTNLIAVGEKSGQLEPMLEKVSTTYENEVEITVTTVTSLLGPLMILVMGGVVLFIVLAILLPIFDLSQAIR
jgi:general secretion pathway protein F